MKTKFFLITLAIVAQPIIIADAAAPEKASVAASGFIGFNKFKANLKKAVTVPAHQIRFLYNWAQQKYALYKAGDYKAVFTITTKDDKHAARLLGGGAAVIVLTALGISAITSYGIMEWKHRNAFKKIRQKNEKIDNYYSFLTRIIDPSGSNDNSLTYYRIEFPRGARGLDWVYNIPADNEFVSLEIQRPYGHFTVKLIGKEATVFAIRDAIMERMNQDSIGITNKSTEFKQWALTFNSSNSSNTTEIE